ncbi:cellulose biosynthesis protein BcsR [Pantoea sp. GD03673]|uniref:cellulose biosynthesis protein BcsR n=1 Tax=Pantoea sp. GD03673 TaxID=2975364 RepID=UPI00244B8594|nr:cellulose biosynthesis protein BcsR [Pantoea sp. GD03673]MDH2068836.1 cellulose biosynthesis protein BcsR [Pantoea sp. GD03673]
MKNQDVYTPVVAHGEPLDDISALRDAFSLHAFSYVDIAREDRLKEVVARWPLLAETVTTPPGRHH